MEWYFAYFDKRQRKCTYELELPLPEAAEVDEGLVDEAGVTLLTTVIVSVPPLAWVEV